MLGRWVNLSAHACLHDGRFSYPLDGIIIRGFLMIKETKKVRVFVCNRTHCYVLVNSHHEWRKLRKFLIKKCFDDTHSMSAFRRPKPPVIVIDLVHQMFASTNITCLAAAASCGIKPLSLKEFLFLYS